MLYSQQSPYMMKSQVQQSPQQYRPVFSQDVTQRYINMYYSRPERFNESQIKKVAQHAEFYKIPFRIVSQEEAEFNVFRAVMNIGEGFLQGFTTIRVGDEPVNVWERVARQVGRAAGFAGFVPSFGSKTVAAAASVIRGKSVPLLVSGAIVNPVAKVVTRAVSTAAASQIGALATAAKFAQNDIVMDIAYGAAKVGTSGAIGQWQDGIDAMMRGFAGGSVMEFGDRLIANALGAAMGNPSAAQTVLRTLSGSLWNGLPSTLRGNSTPEQVYDYVLGGLFAYNDVPAKERYARELVRSTIASKKMSPTDAPDWREYSPDVQKRAIDIYESEVGTRAQRNALVLNIRNEYPDKDLGPAYERQLQLEDRLAELDMKRAELVQQRKEEGATEEEVKIIEKAHEDAKDEEIKVAVGDMLHKIDESVPQSIIDARIEEARLIYRGRGKSSLKSFSGVVSLIPRESVRPLDIAKSHITNSAIVIGDDVVSSAIKTYDVKMNPQDEHNSRVNRLSYTPSDSVWLHVSDSAKMSKMTDSDASIISAAIRGGATIVTDEPALRYFSDNGKAKKFQFYEDFENLMSTTAYKDIPGNEQKYGEFGGIWTRQDIFGGKEGSKYTELYRRASYDNVIRSLEEDGVIINNKIAEALMEVYPKDKSTDSVIGTKTKEFYDMVNKNPSFDALGEYIESLPGVLSENGMDSIVFAYNYIKNYKDTSTKVYDTQTGKFLDIQPNSMLGSLRLSGVSKPRVPNQIEVIGSSKNSGISPDDVIMRIDKIKHLDIDMHGNERVSIYDAIARLDSHNKYGYAYSGLLKTAYTTPVMIQQENGNKIQANKRYFFAGGITDKLFMNMIIEHPDLNSYDYNRLLDELYRSGVDVDKFAAEFDEDYRRFMKSVYAESENPELNKFWQEYYDQAVINQYLYLRDLNGFEDFSFMKDGDFVLSAKALTKRNQIIYNNGAPVDYDALVHTIVTPDGSEMPNNIRYAIYENLSGESKKYNIGGKQYLDAPPEGFAAWEDGTIYLRSYIIDGINSSAGIPKWSGLNKSFITRYGETDESGAPLGALLGKYQFAPMPKGMEEFADREGLDMIIHTSAAKQTGRRIISGRYGDTPAAKYNMPFESIRVVMSEQLKEEKAMGKQRIPKQLLVHIMGTTGNVSSEEQKDFYSWIYNHGVTGEAARNADFEEWVASGSKAGRDIDSIIEDIDDLSIDNVIRLINHPDSDIATMALRKIVTKNTELTGEDSEEGEIPIDSVNSALSPSAAPPQRLVDSSSFYAARSKFSSAYVEQTMRNYIVKRLARPKIGNSTVARIASNNQFTMSETPLIGASKKVFYLGAQYRDKKIKFAHAGKSVTMTLGEMDDVRNAGKDMSLIDSINTALEKVVVMRVPQDSASGAQVLQFAGFANGHKTAQIFMHPFVKEMLGGADDDGDKAYIFFGGRDGDIGDGFNRRHIDILERSGNERILTDENGREYITNPKIASISAGATREAFSQPASGQPVNKPAAFSWARKAANNYEVSSAGDKTYSALYAKLSDGRTIEEAYQQAKGSGKGKKAIHENFDYWGTYLSLWKQWAKENPDKIEALRTKAAGKVLTDVHANTENNQARALAEILNETAPKQQEQAVEQKQKVTVKDYYRYSETKSAQNDPNMVYAMRKGNDIEQFGNPFSGGKGGSLTIKIGGVKECVEAYVKWLQDPNAEFTDINGVVHKNVKPEQRKWILEQIDSGKLDGKTLAYYKQPDVEGGKYYSHADALADFINERRAGKSESDLADMRPTRENISFETGLNKDRISEEFVNSVEPKEVRESAAIETLKSPNTILHNDEIRQLRKELGITTGNFKLKIASASERSDPAFHVAKIKKELATNNYDALYLITKHDGLPMKELLEQKIPKIIHFSITTLGGTKYEPGVMKYNDLLDRIGEYISQGLDPKSITIRIDPIVPRVTKMSDVENVIRRASELGIDRLKVSVLDLYQGPNHNMVRALRDLGYDFSDYVANGKINKHVSSEAADKIGDEFVRIANKYGIKTILSCAENFSNSAISKQGCLDVKDVNSMLGTNISEDAAMPSKQRQGDGEHKCTCFGGKSDLLSYNDKCLSSCIYCYARHDGDTAMQYYNEDGSLKDSVFTRTSNKQPDVEGGKYRSHADALAELVNQRRRVSESRKSITPQEALAGGEIPPAYISSKLTGGAPGAMLDAWRMSAIGRQLLGTAVTYGQNVRSTYNAIRNKYGDKPVYVGEIDGIKTYVRAKDDPGAMNKAISGAVNLSADPADFNRIPSESVFKLFMAKNAFDVMYKDGSKLVMLEDKGSLSQKINPQEMFAFAIRNAIKPFSDLNSKLFGASYENGERRAWSYYDITMARDEFAETPFGDSIGMTQEIIRNIPDGWNSDIFDIKELFPERTADGVAIGIDRIYRAIRTKFAQFKETDEKVVDKFMGLFGLLENKIDGKKFRHFYSTKPNSRILNVSKELLAAKTGSDIYGNERSPRKVAERLKTRADATDMLNNDIMASATAARVIDLYLKNKDNKVSPLTLPKIRSIWEDVNRIKYEIVAARNGNGDSRNVDNDYMAYRLSLTAVEKDVADAFMIGSLQRKIINADEFVNDGSMERKYVFDTNNSALGLSLKALPDQAISRFFKFVDGMLVPRSVKNVPEKPVGELLGLTSVDTPKVTEVPTAAVSDAVKGTARIPELTDLEIAKIEDEITGTKNDLDMVRTDILEMEKPDVVIPLTDSQKKAVEEQTILLQGLADKIKNKLGYTISDTLPLEGLCRGMFNKTATQMSFMDWKAMDNMFTSMNKPSLLSRIFKEKPDEISMLDYFRFPDAVGKRTMAAENSVLLRYVESPYIDKDGNPRTGRGLVPTNMISLIQDDLGTVMQYSTEQYEKFAKRYYDGLLPYVMANGKDGSDLYSLAALRNTLTIVNRKLGSVLSPEDSEKMINMKKHIVSRIEDIIDKNKGLLKKTYIINTGTADVEMTGLDIVKKIRTINSEFNKEMHKLLAGDEQSGNKYMLPVDNIIDKYFGLKHSENEVMLRRYLSNVLPKMIHDHEMFSRDIRKTMLSHKGLPTEIGIDGLSQIAKSFALVDAIKEALGGVNVAKLNSKEFKALIEKVSIINETHKAISRNVSTGEFGEYEYFPHLSHDVPKNKKYIETKLAAATKEYAILDSDIRDTKLSENEIRNIGKRMGALKHEIFRYSSILNGDKAYDMVEDIMGVERAYELLKTKREAELDEKMSSHDKAVAYSNYAQQIESQKPRDWELFWWDVTPNAYMKYIKNANSMFHKKIAYMMVRSSISELQKRNTFGDNTDSWAKWLKLYVSDVLGKPNIITPDLLNDPKMKIKGNPYYWFTDSAVRDTMWKIGTSIGLIKENGKIPVELQKISYEKLTRLSQLEAQYEMASLLAHTKSMVANLFGGTQNTIISAGYGNLKKSNDLKYLRENINPNFNSLRDVHEWVRSLGVVEEYILGEVGRIGSDYRVDMKSFANEVVSKLRKDPDMEDSTLMDIARRYGIGDEMMKKAGWFMRVAERKLRSDAFVAHYIAAAQRFNNGLPTGYDKNGNFVGNPYLIKIAKDGIKTTQFLYTAAYRPAIARTAFGKILTRFQLWSYNSVGFRKNIYEQAKLYGFAQGTEEYDRLSRMATMDIVTMALAQAFMFSIFDATLPAPLNWFVDAAQWLFGDEKEKETAFFGAYPYYVAPLQVVSPPIMRMFPSIVTGLAGGGWQKLTDYTLWTMFPFGRLARDVQKTYINPKSFVERFTGFPVNSLGKKDENKKPSNYPTGGLF